MSARPVLVALVLVAVANGFGQPAPMAPSPKAAAPQVPAGKSTPGVAQKKEEAPKIDGLTIARANGTFLGLQIVNGNFVLTFYGKDKKKAKVDVVRATLRWPVKYQPTDERTVLNPGGPNTLTSSKVVKPPLNFKVYLGLFVAGADAAAESYVVDYREDAAAAPVTKAP